MYRTCYWSYAGGKPKVHPIKLHFWEKFKMNSLNLSRIISCKYYSLLQTEFAPTNIQSVYVMFRKCYQCNPYIEIMSMYVVLIQYEHLA